MAQCNNKQTFWSILSDRLTLVTTTVSPHQMHAGAINMIKMTGDKSSQYVTDELPGTLRGSQQHADIWDR